MASSWVILHCGLIICDTNLLRVLIRNTFPLVDLHVVSKCRHNGLVILRIYIQLTWMAFRWGLVTHICSNDCGHHWFAIVFWIIYEMDDVVYDVYKIPNLGISFEKVDITPYKISTGFDLCHVVLWSGVTRYFTHIFQNCVAGTGATIRLPRCQWHNPGGFVYMMILEVIIQTEQTKHKLCAYFLRHIAVMIWIYHTKLLRFVTFLRRFVPCVAGNTKGRNWKRHEYKWPHKVGKGSHMNTMVSHIHGQPEKPEFFRDKLANPMRTDTPAACVARPLPNMILPLHGNLVFSFQNGRLRQPSDIMLSFKTMMSRFTGMWKGD